MAAQNIIINNLEPITIYIHLYNIFLLLFLFSRNNNGSHQILNILYFYDIIFMMLLLSMLVGEL